MTPDAPNRPAADDALTVRGEHTQCGCGSRTHYLTVTNEVRCYTCNSRFLCARCSIDNRDYWETRANEAERALDAERQAHEATKRELRAQETLTINWREQSDGFERLLNTERTAHESTKADCRLMSQERSEAMRKRDAERQLRQQAERERDKQERRAETAERKVIEERRDRIVYGHQDPAAQFAVRKLVDDLRKAEAELAALRSREAPSDLPLDEIEAAREALIAACGDSTFMREVFANDGYAPEAVDYLMLLTEHAPALVTGIRARDQRIAELEQVAARLKARSDSLTAIHDYVKAKDYKFICKAIPYMDSLHARIAELAADNNDAAHAVLNAERARDAAESELSKLRAEHAALTVNYEEALKFRQAARAAFKERDEAIAGKDAAERKLRDDAFMLDWYERRISLISKTIAAYPTEADRNDWNDGSWGVRGMRINKIAPEPAPPPEARAATTIDPVLRADSLTLDYCDAGVAVIRDGIGEVSTKKLYGLIKELADEAGRLRVARQEDAAIEDMDADKVLAESGIDAAAELKKVLERIDKEHPAPPPAGKSAADTSIGSREAAMHKCDFCEQPGATEEIRGGGWSLWAHPACQRDPAAAGFIRLKHDISVLDEIRADLAKCAQERDEALRSALDRARECKEAQADARRVREREQYVLRKAKEAHHANDQDRRVGVRENLNDVIYAITHQLAVDVNGVIKEEAPAPPPAGDGE